MGTTAAEKNFIDNYVTPNREPDWADYARQPENVFFSHVAHVKLGQLKCEQCHGDDGRDRRAAPLPGGPHQRLLARHLGGVVVRAKAGAAPGMKMDDCVECHREAGAFAQLPGLP